MDAASVRRTAAEAGVGEGDWGVKPLGFGDLMVTFLEQRLSRFLRVVLHEVTIGDEIPDSETYTKALIGFQFFLPKILGEIHREWTFEGLDEIQPAISRKLGKYEIEILGVCCIVTDQSLTPVHVRAQIAENEDEISWMECRLGEYEQEIMSREPYANLKGMNQRLRNLTMGYLEVNWFYKVTFGERYD